MVWISIFVCLNLFHAATSFSWHRPDLSESCTERLDNYAECFESVDWSGNGYLNKWEFTKLLRVLFVKDDETCAVSHEYIHEIYHLLCRKIFGIDKDTFYTWIKEVVNPVSALLVTDVQNDFIDGSLAIIEGPARQDGAEVVPVLNQIVESVDFDVVVYTHDWHPADHISFINNVALRAIHSSSKVTAESAEVFDTVIFTGPPVMSQILWPAHCVQNTWGAELHLNLTVIENHVHINKGTNPDIDSYSAFWDNGKLSQTSLLSELQDHGVTDVYIGGLAYEYCVGWTAQDAMDLGFRTVIVDDATRGLNVTAIEATRIMVMERNGAIVNSAEVEDMVRGVKRNPKLAMSTAKRIASQRSEDEITEDCWLCDWFSHFFEHFFS